MFKRMDHGSAGYKIITLTVEGKEITAYESDTVAAAMLAAGFTYMRITPVKEKQRGPYCMMGICFDCMVEINGVPDQRACQVLVQPGMRVNIQVKAGGLDL